MDFELDRSDPVGPLIEQAAALDESRTLDLLRAELFADAAVIDRAVAAVREYDLVAELQDAVTDVAGRLLIDEHMLREAAVHACVATVAADALNAADRAALALPWAYAAVTP